DRLAVVIRADHGEYLDVKKHQKQVLQADIELDRNKIDLLHRANDGEGRDQQQKYVFDQMDGFSDRGLSHQQSYSAGSAAGMAGCRACPALLPSKACAM